MDDEAEARWLFWVYERTDYLEGFCFALGLDPDDPAAIELFETVHRSYVEVWKTMGNEEFQHLIDQAA